MDAITLVGLMTVSLTSLGGLLGLSHFRFFLSSHSRVARRLRMVYITDVGVYVSTMAFGVWALFSFDAGAEEWNEFWRILLYTIRIFCLAGNVWASFQLYRLFRDADL